MSLYLYGLCLQSCNCPVWMQWLYTNVRELANGAGERECEFLRIQFSNQPSAISQHIDSKLVMDIICGGGILVYRLARTIWLGLAFQMS